MNSFKAESKKLLEMMIHSIYTDKDIFLRELISNASDALDKRHMKTLDDHPAQADRSKLKIDLIADQKARTLTIRDNGCGMTKEELEKNLGTIAHSGSQEFKKDREKIQNEKTPSSESRKDAEEEKIAEIIGQFGVGFYSAFMVADRVEVLTKPMTGDQAYRWTSAGAEGYQIEEAEKEEIGTEVILYLRPDEEGEEVEKYSAYLEPYTLESLVERYSNYIRYPIRMEIEHTKKVDPPENASEEEKEEYEKNPKHEKVREWETLNSMTPIWEEPKSSLSDEDYIHFYQQEHLGFEEPLAWIHLVADGTLTYRAILYLPSALPWDFYTREFKKGLTLYSSGVKIMDHADQLLPDYYSFVQGVVSSEDFDLNLSRETLQQNRQILSIARKIENKITDQLMEMKKEEPEKYKTFFELFGPTLKAGIYQSFGAKSDQLAPLLIFSTSRSMDQKRSLDEITEGMKEEEKIYYATGKDLGQIDRLPMMGALKEKDIEVLYLTETLDEFTIKAMREYQGHPFQSIQSEAFSLPGQEKKDQEEPEEKTKALFAAMKEILNGEVEEVKASSRLQEDAAILVAKGEISIEMERTLADQPGMAPVKAEKILEMNPGHPLMEKLLAMQAEKKQEELETYTRLLYDQARLIAGLGIEDPVAFSREIQKMMK